MEELGKLPLWEKMAPITLEEMDSIRLMNRIDSKFVTSQSKLISVLEDAAKSGYRVCTIEGSKILDYDSVYYDTDGLAMYIAHHNGRKVRQKVRVRTYLISDTTYLEIKKKNNRGRTKKKRIKMPGEYAMNLEKYGEGAEFLVSNSWWSSSQLSPALSTSFSRITLVNPSKTERLTIDTALNFHNFRNGNSANLKDAVIIELKQDGRAQSQMRDILLEHRIFPFRVSKYCIGTALTDPDVKSGRFKIKIRSIEKIINKKLCYHSK